MPQSLVQVYLHIIFSTKYRTPWILPHFEAKLYKFLEDQCNQAGSIALEVGGSTDHVHILCRHSKHITIPKLLEKVKSTSSKWMKSQNDLLSDFYWQDGYAAISVSPNEVDIIRQYIRNQAVNHISKTFKEEYLELLQKYNVDFDPQYLWEDDTQKKG